MHVKPYHVHVTRRSILQHFPGNILSVRLALNTYNKDFYLIKNCAVPVHAYLTFDVQRVAL
jgi:hypothetical protein